MRKGAGRDGVARVVREEGAAESTRGEASAERAFMAAGGAVERTEAAAGTESGVAGLAGAAVLELTNFRSLESY